MSQLVAVAIGALLGLLVLIVGVGGARRLDRPEEQRRQDERKTRLRDYRSAGRLSSAYAASDLVPWILGMADLEESRIQVFGGDGTYINQERGFVWSDGIKDWLREGLNVDYILLGIDKSTREKYMALMDKLNVDGSARLRVKVARQPDKGYPDAVKQTEVDLRTCHPTLLYGRDGHPRAMWIEGDHQPNSEFAYGVSYVPPNAMDDEWKQEFEHYERQIEAIKPYCVDLADVQI